MCWSGRCACRARARRPRSPPPSRLQRAARRRARCRGPICIIVARGGGSLEDLWSLQRGDRGARRGRQHDPADLGGRPRDRHHADRFRRRPARADADRRGRDGGAGARRICWRGIGDARRAASSPAGSAAWSSAAPSCALLSRALPAPTTCSAVPRQRLDACADAAAARAHRQCADPSPAATRVCGAAVAAPAVAARLERAGKRDRRRPRRAAASLPARLSRPPRRARARGRAVARAPILIAACSSAALRWCATARASRCARRPRCRRHAARHRICRRPRRRGGRGRPAKTATEPRGSRRKPTPRRGAERRGRATGQAARGILFWWVSPPRPTRLS